jgi:hypothetical protein
MAQKSKTLEASEAVLELEVYSVPVVLMAANARVVAHSLLLMVAMM